jgi:SsuE family FMN reductase
MNVVTISGSPSPRSRSAWLTELVQARLETTSHALHRIIVRELPAQALMAADAGDPVLRKAVERAVAAQLVVVATPIYKAAYSGLLKLFLDLMPQDAFRGKRVLPIATGGSLAHMLALDYAVPHGGGMPLSILEETMNSYPTTRRNWLRLALAAVSLLGAALGAESGHAQAQPRELRIGYQKYGTLTILKSRGELEKRLAPQGIAVKWTEFPAGPQLLEGLNVGSIDFGTVGEAPPIFAQAAGADLVYVANQPPAPAGEAIVVRKDSPIATVADLKGRKIALNKARR